MKKHLLLFSMLLLSAVGYAQTAQIQIIHNSPDSQLSVADIYVVAGAITLSFDDVDYRTVLPAIDIEESTPVTIYFAASDSDSEADALSSQSIGSIPDGKKYVAIANGILSTSTGYNPSPDFNVTVYTTPRDVANNSANTDLLFFNGATDAPTLDIYPYHGTTPLADNISYEEFSADYLELPAIQTILEVRDQTGTNVFATYALPLDQMGFEGQTGYLFASGFLDPENNNNGPEVDLFFAPSAGGMLSALPLYEPVSFVQIIHASADDALSTVDVYVDLDGEITKYDDLQFLTSTEFIEVSSGIDIDIVIAPSNSTSIADGIFTKSVGSLDDFVAYVAVINGINSSTGYSPAPALDIDIYDNAETEAVNASDVDALFFNASTDAPALDLNDQIATSTIIDGVGYGNFSDYVAFSYQNYVLAAVNDATDDVIASYDVPLPLSGLQGYAMTLVAVGFVDPAANSDGLPFALYGASPEGGDLFPLPVNTTTSVNQLSDAQMSVFPVPATEAVTVSLENAGTVEVFSAQGEVVMTSSVSSGNNNLNVSSLKPGMYTLRVTSADKVGVRKIVIAK